MLQRSLDPDEDDPVIEGVHVERDDQRYSGYGSIVRFVLYRGNALMELDDQLAAALDAPDHCREVTLGFSSNDAALAELRGGPARLFTGCECFADQT